MSVLNGNILGQKYNKPLPQRHPQANLSTGQKLSSYFFPPQDASWPNLDKVWVAVEVQAWLLKMHAGAARPGLSEDAGCSRSDGLLHPPAPPWAKLPQARDPLWIRSQLTKSVNIMQRRASGEPQAKAK